MSTLLCVSQTTAPVTSPSAPSLALCIAGEVIVSLLIAWGLMAVWFIILYFIGISIRKNNYISESTSAPALWPSFIEVWCDKCTSPAYRNCCVPFLHIVLDTG